MVLLLHSYTPHSLKTFNSIKLNSHGSNMCFLVLKLIFFEFLWLVSSRCAMANHPHTSYVIHV